MNMYLVSDTIRFDAFKRKKENLDEYADLIFKEIIRSSLSDNKVIIESLSELKAKKRLCLFGYPGVDKTSCALEFSYQQMDKNNKRIIWIDPEDQTKISKCLTDFGKLIEKNETNIDKIKINFLNYINKEDVLIIFDNLESLDDLKQTLTIEMIKAPFLITTRLSKMGNFDMIEIQPFKETEAKQFLRKRCHN